MVWKITIGYERNSKDVKTGDHIDIEYYLEILRGLGLDDFKTIKFELKNEF